MGRIAANAVRHGDRARAGRALTLVESSHPDHREDYRRARHTRQMAFAEATRAARELSGAIRLLRGPITQIPVLTCSAQEGAV
jgi:hypothetical protein